MKKLVKFMVIGALCAGCSTFDRTAFNVTKTAVTLTDAGMVAYSQFYRVAWNNPELYNTTTNVLAEQRRIVSGFAYNVGISAELAETLRRSYKTNSAIRPELEVVLLTVGGNASNIVWVINQNLKP